MNNFNSITRLAGIIMLLMFTGCTFVSTVNIEAKQPLASKTTEHMMAGVSVVDITPQVGIPMNGYSVSGNKSEGVRTKLKARAFYIKPKQGDPLAIVQLDMLSGESTLHHRVAELVASKTDIKPQNLTLNATHTHSGPGQYHSNDAFNSFASNTAGFNPELFEELAQRISSALISAYDSQRPAKIATGTIDVWGLTRNRSHEPYTANTDVSNKDLAVHRRYQAIDPVLSMTRIDVVSDDGSYQPLGAISTFAIHGTALSSDVAIYSADVWAYISQELEWSIKEYYQPSWMPVHGPFQGTHADVAPNVTRNMMGYIEARKVGEGIAGKAWQLFRSLDDKLNDDVTIKSAMREIDMLENPRIGDVEICDRAYFGTAQIAAPDEHETPIIYYIPPFKRGWPAKLFKGCHGGKHIAGWALFQGMIFKERDFPFLLNVHIAQIGDSLLISLPFEISVKGGEQIKAKVRQVIDNPAIKNIAVSSVANGYFGYAVTAEEYALQWYEGGSTIYGPSTVPYLAAQSAKLTKEVLASNESIGDLPSSWQQQLKSKDFSLPTLTPTGGRVALQDIRYREAAINQESYWAFAWKDVPPSMINLHEPLIGIEYKTKGTDWTLLKQQNRPVNDSGYDIAIIYQGKTDSENRGHYEARWFNPEVNPDYQYRFSIEPRDKQPQFYSAPFSW